MKRGVRAQVVIKDVLVPFLSQVWVGIENMEYHFLDSIDRGE